MEAKTNPATTTAIQPAPQLPAPVANPFTRAQSEYIAPGAVAIESERAIAEAQGKLVIAKRFPRDPMKAWEAVRQACHRKGLAAEAFYSYPRGKQTITGPSIRLAEEMARCWGNVDYGLRELSNREGLSEMEAYAWDMETNTVSKQQFTVRHIRDKQDGSQVLTEQRDIYEITANMGARRMRARILAILPADLVDMAIIECRQTIEGSGSEPIADRVRKMIAAFSSVGVTATHIEERLGHGLTDTLPDELTTLQGIYRAIKDGESKASDWFGVKIEQPTVKQPDPKADAKPPAVAAVDKQPDAPPPVVEEPKKKKERKMVAQDVTAAANAAPPATPDPTTTAAIPAAATVTTFTKPTEPAKPAATDKPSGDLF